MAWTLPELLVILGVIALAVAIVLPAYWIVIENSHVTKDLSNLRQLALSANLYLIEERCYPGTEWASSLNPKYTSSWGLFQSPFDKRIRSEIPEIAPVSYDMNGQLWGINPFQVASPADCILFAPLMTDPSLLLFTGTAWRPCASSPLRINTNGAADTGGTNQKGAKISVVFCDLHAAVMSMSDFHSEIANRESGSVIKDVRWNK